MSHQSPSVRCRAREHNSRQSESRASASSPVPSHASACRPVTSSFSAVRRSVSTLSDRGLLNATAKLAKTERLTTLEILVHLNEIGRRELYLGLGYGSMFDYCVTHLGYSRSAAWRRIHSARCLGRHPEVYDMVEKDDLSLTTLFLIATALTEENKKELLAQVRGRSQEKVQKILATYQPPVTYRDRVKPVCVTVPAPKNSSPAERPHSSSPARLEINADHRPAGESTIAKRHTTGEVNSDGPSSQGSHATSVGTASERGTPGYTLETKFLIHFVASEAFMAKYQEARALLSNKLTQLSFENVLEAALDGFLDKHSPARRHARREKRAAKKKRAAQKEEARENREPQGQHRHHAQRTPKPKTQDANPASHVDQLSRKKFDGRCRSGTDIMLTKTRGESTRDHAKGRQRKTIARDPNETPDNTRYISANARDAVFVRDNNRCTHVGTNGKRCTSTYRLQIDHIVPHARGGTNDISNLRLLCAKHNKLEAKRVYGAAKIDGYSKRE